MNFGSLIIFPSRGQLYRIGMDNHTPPAHWLRKKTKVVIRDHVMRNSYVKPNKNGSFFWARRFTIGGRDINVWIDFISKKHKIIYTEPYPVLRSSSPTIPKPFVFSLIPHDNLAPPTTHNHQRHPPPPTRHNPTSVLLLLASRLPPRQPLETYLKHQVYHEHVFRLFSIRQHRRCRFWVDAIHHHKHQPNTSGLRIPHQNATHTAVRFHHIVTERLPVIPFLHQVPLPTVNTQGVSSEAGDEVIRRGVCTRIHYSVGDTAIVFSSFLFWFEFGGSGISFCLVSIHITLVLMLF